MRPKGKARIRTTRGASSATAKRQAHAKRDESSKNDTRVDDGDRKCTADERATKVQRATTDETQQQVRGARTSEHGGRDAPKVKTAAGSRGARRGTGASAPSGEGDRPPDTQSKKHTHRAECEQRQKIDIEEVRAEKTGGRKRTNSTSRWEGGTGIGEGDERDARVRRKVDKGRGGAPVGNG